MATGIENADDFAPGADRPGDPNAFAVGPGDPLGDAGFAIAGRTVQEQALAGNDGPSEAVEDFFAERQIGERPAEVLVARLEILQRLGRDTGRIIVQANGRGAESNRNVWANLWPRVRAGLGQFVNVVAHTGRCFEDHQAIRLHGVEQLLANTERDADLLGDFVGPSHF